jgi:8-oxo-dGTP diphosphatase
VERPRPTIVVVAGVLVEGGRVLTSRRPAGGHLAGAWEFPGGKVEPDEDPRQALARELHEELGIEVEVGEVLETVFHRYDHKSVLLLFYAVTRASHSPAPRALQVAELAWRDLGELDAVELAPADVPFLPRLRELLARG